MQHPSIGPFLVIASLVGCGGGDGDADAADAAAPVVTLAVPCTDTAESLYVGVPSGLPAYDASHRGDVFRCAPDRWISATELDAVARANGYAGPALTSGATVFRIVYRTERVAVNGAPAPEGHSSAFLLVPDAPRSPGGLVVYAHPSVGIAPVCAPSRIDLTVADDPWEPVRAPILALVGDGWTVIAPDYAGFGFGDAPGFANAEDEAHSILDATRAAAKALPAGMLPDKVAIVGHSIGGHGALSAHSYAASYGHSGELVGVAIYAPFWVSGLAWGAILYPASGFNVQNAAYVLEYQLDFFFANGELLDGTGHGTDLLQADKRDPARQLLSTQCLDEVAEQIGTLGPRPIDYFTPEAVDVLGPCGITGDCTAAGAAPGGTRFKTNRPPVDAAGPPIAMWFGGADTTIPPSFARCAVDKLERDVGTSGTTRLVSCLDPTATHTAVPAAQAAWVNAWIGARVSGGTEPTCTEPPRPAAGGAECPAVPLND
jgi:pimeloyl-ACP methyl ester carboxylesterase